MEFTPSLHAVSVILLYMAGISIIFAGISLSIRNFFVSAPLDIDEIILAFWIGFAAVIAFLQIWHFFFAVNWRARAVVAAIGLLCCWLNHRALAAWLRRVTRTKFPAGAIVLALLTAVWVANRSSGPPDAFDSGMYHIPTVSWYTQYPVVLGLGNLHDRLGFNSSSLLYDALLAFYSGMSLPSHIANGLLILMFTFQVMVSASRILRSRTLREAPYLFDVVLLPVLVVILRSHDVSSFTTDIPPAVVLFVVCSQTLRLLNAGCAPDNWYRALVVTTLAVLCITLKTSYVVVGALLVVLTLVFVLREAPRQIGARVLTWSAAFGILLVLPWLMHGIFLSGYPVYPSTLGGLPVDWKVPATLANATRLWIVTFARHSNAGGVSWFADWLRVRSLFGVVTPLCLAAASLCMTGLMRIRNGRSAHADRGWWLILTCAVAALFWFLSAPASRFGFAVLWSLAAACVAQTADYFRARTIVTHFGLPAAILILVVLASNKTPSVHSLKSILSTVWIRPGPENGMYPYPRPELRNFRTASGLVLLVPTSNNECFDAPLPCTPHPASDLVATQASNGRLKFVTNGPWEQENWPHPNNDRLKVDFLRRLGKLAK